MRLRSKGLRNPNKVKIHLGSKFCQKLQRTKQCALVCACSLHQHGLLQASTSMLQADSADLPKAKESDRGLVR